MVKIYLLLIAALGLSSFKGVFYNESNLRNNSSCHFQSDTTQYAIISFDKSSWFFENAKPAGLNNKEIEQIEELLKEAIKKHNKAIANEAFALKPLKRYKRQLVPVINNKGEKEVWVNCLCDVHGDNWRNQIIFVNDGGNCYFNLKINLTTKTFYDIQVNGYA